MFRNRLFCFIISLIAGCKTSSEIRGYNYYSHTPVIDWDKSVKLLENEYDAYKFQDLKIYRFIFFHQELSNPGQQQPEKRSYYFIFHKDSATGKAYSDSLFFGTNRRFKVDSMLSKNLFISHKFDTLLRLQPDSILEGQNGDLIKVYTYPVAKDEPGKFLVYLYYSKKIINPDHVFSEKMDNVKGRRLYRVSTKASEAFYPKDNFTMPAREYYLLMREIPNIDTTTIMRFVKKYRSGS
jgi:hypothetical protein